MQCCPSKAPYLLTDDNLKLSSAKLEFYRKLDMFWENFEFSPRTVVCSEFRSFLRNLKLARKLQVGYSLNASFLLYLSVVTSQ